MKKLIVAAASIAVLGAAALPAAAQTAPVTGAYGTIGYSLFNTPATNLDTVQARLGYRFHPNVAIEGEGALGFDRDRVGGFGPGHYDVRVSRNVAAYVVGLLPVSDRLDLFGRVGYGDNRLRITVPGVQGGTTTSTESWNYGGGAQYNFDGRNGLRVDYTRHDLRGGGQANAWTLAFARKF